MSDLHTRFARHLQDLAAHNRGAMAALRRSLSFPPGTHAPAMPYVEPFVDTDGSRESPRVALYVAAALFAANPRHRAGQSFATALAVARLRRKSDSIEQRFIAVLDSDADALPVHLRHAMSLLAAEKLGFDLPRLAADLAWWLDPWHDSARDRVRQQWACDFYGRKVQAVMGQPSADNPDTESQPSEEPTP